MPKVQAHRPTAARVTPECRRGARRRSATGGSERTKKTASVQRARVRGDRKTKEVIARAPGFVGTSAGTGRAAGSPPCLVPRGQRTVDAVWPGGTFCGASGPEPALRSALPV